MIPIYLQGLSLGLAYVAPIGMQNLFVINSAMTQKLTRVMCTALIVIFWDISLATACFLGAGALLQTMTWLQKIVLGAGGFLVIYIGMSLINSSADLHGGKDVNQPISKIIWSAFVVTWLNPQALIDGTLMLGAFRASQTIGTEQYFIMGFISASVIWFTSLAIIVYVLGSKINSRVLTWINRICGIVIVIYGINLLWKLLQMIF